MQPQYPPGPTYAQPPPSGQNYYPPPPYQQAMPVAQPQQYAPQQYMAGPPMGYGGPQMQGGGGTVVIVDQGGAPGGFGNMPSACVCPACHAHVSNAVTVSPGATSWLCCIGLCFVGFWPCALIPVRLLRARARARAQQSEPAARPPLPAPPLTRSTLSPLHSPRDAVLRRHLPGRDAQLPQLRLCDPAQARLYGLRGGAQRAPSGARPPFTKRGLSSAEPC